MQYVPPPIQHDLFSVSLLRSWGGEWMWASIQVVGSLEAVVEAYKNGTLFGALILMVHMIK
jgi:hypothetical protein